MSVLSKTFLLNMQKNVLKLKQETLKGGQGNRANVAEALRNDEIDILYEKTSWEFQTEKH